MTCLLVRRFFLIAIFLLAGTALIAQQAELKIEVKPKEAFIFVDGKPYNHHDRKLELTPGEHMIGVYNYGFVPQMQKVVLKAGDNPGLDIQLAATGNPVQGPWGRLEIEGVHNRDAVFLNGNTHEFFVGHVDETTSHVLLSQKMVLPPGIHQVRIVDPRFDKEAYAGSVEIIANRKAILDVEKGTVRYEPWSDGSKINSMPRFSSDATETIVAVAPVVGKLAVEPVEINCGQPVRLSWNASDAVYGTIKVNGVPLGGGSVTGDQTVSPKETTTYEFQAVGPGGTFTTQQTVRVNNTVQTSLAAFPTELRYHKVDDNVVEQGTATLKWSASNADSVRIDPIGPVSGASGETLITAVPSKTDIGPVAEMKTYRITATNACGGSDTSTASVHVTGTIDHQVAQALPPVKLPESGSPLPIIGLLGIGSVVSGMVLRRFRKNL
jgi:hypothetical protein